jgi:ribose transport system permease protein
MTTTTVLAPEGRPRRGFFGIQRMRREGATPAVLAFVVFLVVYLIINPGLLTPLQFMNTANVVVPVAIATIAQLIIVTTGGIDISIGAVMSLANVIFATQFALVPWPVAVLMGLGTGLACGLINGLFVAYLRLPAIAVTLATAFIFGALAREILDRPGGALDESVYAVLAGNLVPFIPLAYVWLGLAVVVTWFLLQKTRIGRTVYGVGSSEHAVSSAGMHSRLSVLFAFGLSGLLVGLAAIFLAGSTMTGDPRSGDPYVLTTIAAVALSGASFAGGRGSILGAILAAITLTLVNKLLFFANINSYWQYVISALIVFAVVGVPVIISRIAGQARGRRNG